MKRKKLTCEEARNSCILKTLELLGYTPIRRTKTDAWYLSPLRSETNPSFHVSVVKNRWYDHGLGKGGNVIDLVMNKTQATVKEALDFLAQIESSFSFHRPEPLAFRENKINVVKVLTISHPALIKYLQERCIPLEVAREYCKEAWYTLNGKTFFAIGMKNHLGGWELRNKYYKNSTSPKSYTYLKKPSNRLVITEGMFDFLSLATIDRKLINANDCIVLNSLNFLFEIEVMFSSYHTSYLYFDNDTAGIEARMRIQKKYRNTVERNNLYSEFNDLNEFLVKRNFLYPISLRKI